MSALFHATTDGIRAAVGDEGEVSAVEGVSLMKYDGDSPVFDEHDIPAAARAAPRADAVVLAIGGNELTGKENQDSDDISWPGRQRELAQAVPAAKCLRSPQGSATFRYWPFRRSTSHSPPLKARQTPPPCLCSSRSRVPLGPLEAICNLRYQPEHANLSATHWGQEQEAMKKIYVGNLPFSATDDEIRGLFETHGEVESVNLITDRETGRPRGFGFVEMSSGGDEAIAALNQTNMGDRSLTVNEARPRNDRGGGGGGGGGRRDRW